ncbi:hypothetical protein U472_06915 [Orenia metallireducens]|uniref:Uncharacterized protein n=1 Tax=Orenia metallireducens TaxID=1413210 RepID=A0A1C0AA93_9FIRM|nr:hypothetical protein [Orenia metallireducens]OCL27196.1 hypothetical protein U472_06915 [Orenia metallireducens]
MGRIFKIEFILIIFLIMLVGCSEMDISQNPQIQLINYPKLITLGENFSLSGEFLTQEMIGDNIKILLTIRNGNDGSGVLNQELSLSSGSQSFSFIDIRLEGDISPVVYFEFKLIIDGKFILKVDTEDSPTYVGNWHTDIITSYFNAYSSSGEPLKATWGNYLKDENPYYFALPYRDFYYYVDGELIKKDYYGVSDVKNRWIEIYHPLTNKTAYAQWEDVGPWNYYDPHYVFSTTNQRPYAEMGIDMGWSSQGYRFTNKAGLDISPATMEYLDSDGLAKGKIIVNWKFVDISQVPDGPWLERISGVEADSKVLNLNTNTLRTLN